MDLDTAFVEIGVLCGIVNKLGQFALTHFRCAVAEDEQKGVDGIGFSRTVWPDDGRKGLVDCELKSDKKQSLTSIPCGMDRYLVFLRSS
jgi:hypothetical protein